MTLNAPRLPAVMPLSTFLPSGSEGGKEFARIVGLLLFQDAKRHGREFNLFDDASGDYQGLDSFSRPAQGDKLTGFQYKYFPSPLSDNHRSEIQKSIARAAARPNNLALEKYVIVTPDDLKNSGRRAGGGDVEWFEKIRGKYKDRFEVEHIGHSKIQSLFLQAPHLCLYYYPSLIPSGLSRRRTIQEVRSLYDASIKSRFGRIEFVGMSVYKEEASRRIRLENIYIPLSVVPERAPDESEDTPRANPASFLSPGARTVILGDPGSGKSTLMAFLALAGTNESLQKRCKVSADDRLTVIVTLRRYADELKEKINLSLLEYIVESTKADFSIDAFDKEFLEFYLDSGKAILLFDGLDELPGSHFKSVVRKRIESFNATYPTNTLIITSRIVGYEAEVRFDESYSHFRVAKLRTPEIEQFIIDWYTARIEDQLDRIKNSADLVRVINNPDNDAIRDLARNPLLLTIVALVHRIDAVLPDQRVVLYQKCTETLLNTWHKAKQRDEELAKGRIERRNRLRVEAIAYWMHCRSLQDSGRSVSPHSELLSFLTDYIESKEVSTSNGEHPEDQAEIFLEFIKSGAGLLIEAGDGLYSFIHLTFQEYLSAMHLTSNGELGGAQAIWNEMGGNLDNPRWREVVRLLVASLRSIMGQKFFIDKLLSLENTKESRDRALLLLGLLRDGIEPAEEEACAIVTHALRTSVKFDGADDLRLVVGAIRGWIDKLPENATIAESAFNALQETLSPNEVLALALTRLMTGLSPIEYDELINASSDNLHGAVYFAYARLILNETCRGDPLNWVHASAVNDLLATANPEGNVAAAAGLGISILINPVNAPHQLLSRELIMLGTADYGPYSDHLMNLLAIALPQVSLPAQIMKALRNAFAGRQELRRNKKILSVFLRRMRDLFTDDEYKAHGLGQGITGLIRETLSERINNDPNLEALARGRVRRPDEATHSRELKLIQDAFNEKMDADPGSYWRMILGSEIYDQIIFPSVFSFLKLSPQPHWQEGLRISFETRVPLALASYLDSENWDKLRQRLLDGSENIMDLNFAAWLLLLDTWTWEHQGYSNPIESPFHGLAEAARGRLHPPLQFALCVRGICLGERDCEQQLQELTSAQDSPTIAVLADAGWPRLGTRRRNGGRKRSRRNDTQ